MDDDDARKLVVEARDAAKAPRAGWIALCLAGALALFVLAAREDRRVAWALVALAVVALAALLWVWRLA